MVEDAEVRANRRGNMRLGISAQEWIVAILIIYAGLVSCRVLLDSLRPGSHFYYSARYVFAPATSSSYQRSTYFGIGHLVFHMVVGAVVGLGILFEKRNFSLRRILAACILVGATGAFGILSRDLTTTVALFRLGLKSH